MADVATAGLSVLMAWPPGRVLESRAGGWWATGAAAGCGMDTAVGTLGIVTGGGCGTLAIVGGRAAGEGSEIKKIFKYFCKKM